MEVYNNSQERYLTTCHDLSTIYLKQVSMEDIRRISNPKNEVGGGTGIVELYHVITSPEGKVSFELIDSLEGKCIKSQGLENKKVFLGHQKRYWATFEFCKKIFSGIQTKERLLELMKEEFGDVLRFIEITRITTNTQGHVDFEKLGLPYQITD